MSKKMTELRVIRKDIREIEELISEVRHSTKHSKSKKDELIKDLKLEMRKLKRKEAKEIRIFIDSPHYAQVPTALLRDPTIPLQAKGMYAVLHSYAQYKELMAMPTAWPSLETIAKVTGFSERWCAKLIKILIEAGWVKVEDRGYNISNEYKLLPKKRRVR